MGMRGVVEQPAGLRYEPELRTADRERSLLSAFAGYAFHEVVMHGQAAKRTVCHFGVGYDYVAAQHPPGAPAAVFGHVPHPPLPCTAARRMRRVVLRARCRALATGRASMLG